MLVRALTFDGLVEDPDWVYRWRDRTWGATGIAHFYREEALREGQPPDRSRAVLEHVLDRLEIRPELRRAWCASHAEDLIVHEFRGVWPRSVPERMRDRRVLRVRVAEMWQLEPLVAGVGQAGIA